MRRERLTWHILSDDYLPVRLHLALTICDIYNWMNGGMNIIDCAGHKWSFRSGTKDTGSVLVRINDTALQWARRGELNIRVGFAVPFTVKSAGDLAGPDGDVPLDAIEEALCHLMENTGPGIEVLVITAAEFREFVFYIESADRIAHAHKAIMKMFPKIEIQCYGYVDTEWDVYFEWKA